MASNIDTQIKEKGDLIRQLKADPSSDEATVKTAVSELLALKAEKAKSEGRDPSEVKEGSSAGGSKKGKNAITLKVPKGTKDHLPEEMLLRNSIFKTITDVFQLHGGVTIDTPVFELKEILAGKYGEDSKLIYDLQDQGGELCSLRYDLTVPFARFLAMHGSNFQNIKRYHIAKVYRRDNPAMTKGRMREFYQCDFDIAGTYDAMVPDAEIIKIVVQIFDRLQIGDFTIKINHRKILDGIFAVCGVPQEKIRTISSAVDKLDKSPWLEVKREMTEEKGLPDEVADRIGEYVKLKGSEELLTKLQQDATLTSNASASAGLQDMEKLFSYLKAFNVVPRVSFDLSLARGLDYYTGIIYECIVEGSAPPGFKDAQATPAAPKPSKKKGKDDEVDESQIGVGSIAGGGRYDDLVGMFSSAKGDKGKIPCVGISFGVERIFSILQSKQVKKEQQKTKDVDVFVMSMGDGLLLERMSIADQLWSAGLKTEYLYKTKPKAAAQWDAIERNQVPLVVIVAPDEWKQGQVRVKEQTVKEADNKGQLVNVQQLDGYLKEKLAALQA